MCVKLFFVFIFTKKTMKSIARITRRLMSLFLVLVASSIMFLPSPAIAATSWITINPDNVETELLESSKSAIVLLVSPDLPKSLLEELEQKTEKFYGDGYKYVAGTIEENRSLYSYVIAPPIYPPLPGLLAVKNGEPIRGIFIDGNNPTPAFEYVKEQLGAGS
jgi:hypothetical protein